MDSNLQEIVSELEEVEGKLKAQVEKLFGPIESTDFADEYAELARVHDKLKALAAPAPEA